MEVLRIADVIKYYGKGGTVTKAVDGISFSINSAEFVTIMGASGSGKTTLLNMIATIDTVSAGKIYIGGKDITVMGEKEVSRFRLEKLGFIFQDYNLLDTLTIYENIALPLSLKNINDHAIEQKIQKLSLTFGLSAILSKFPYQISGGERQRTACARALISGPELILADEPTGALDSKNSKNLMRLLNLMNSENGATILTVTHDPLVASYAGRVLFLRDGKIYNEIIKGEKTNDKFFKEIITINAAAGGENYDL